MPPKPTCPTSVDRCGARRQGGVGHVVFGGLFSLISLFSEFMKFMNSSTQYRQLAILNKVKTPVFTSFYLILPQSAALTILFPYLLESVLFQRLPVWRHINIGTIDNPLFVSLVDIELLTDLVPRLC